MEIDERVKRQDAKGKPLLAGIELLEDIAHGLPVNAIAAMIYATESFFDAMAKNPAHLRKDGDGLSQSERWDLKLF